MSRSKIEEFGRHFAELHARLCDLARGAEAAGLYRTAGNPDALWPTSPSALLVRSAATVEQMINGITVRLWDDPFEWTLPERLGNTADLIAYFNEVEEARTRGFDFFQDDRDLERSIPAPVELKTLEQVLKETLARSQTYLSRAATMLNATEGDQ